MTTFNFPASHISSTFTTPALPPHCEPTTPFLIHISSIFHSCVPTPLAAVSTALGLLSILSWLFAQLPQIIKNHRLQSTSGLSFAFLLEWCLGDLTNLLGCLLTGQAGWQIVIGAYYCVVDLVLVAQWIWFEGLGRGRAVNVVWLKTRARRRGNTEDREGDMQQMTHSVADTEIAKPQDISRPKDQHKQNNLFNTPNYGSFRIGSNDSPTTSTKGKRIHRPHGSSWPLPSPSPRTVLLISLVLCLASTSPIASASPTPTPLHVQHAALSGDFHTHLPPLGTILSWTSTTMYLLSRLPQLLKNFRLRSTAGLSPLLFAAAFSGNLFYSSSLLLNPNLWHDYEAYGGGGWADEHGSKRAEWMFRALPFWLGAAGVLVMDAGIGVQFWLWREVETEGEILVAEEEGQGLRGRKKWKEVHGWMRGWVPTGRMSFGRLSSSTSEEDGPLLGSEGRGPS